MNVEGEEQDLDVEATECLNAEEHKNDETSSNQMYFEPQTSLPLRALQGSSPLHGHTCHKHALVDEKHSLRAEGSALYSLVG